MQEEWKAFPWFNIPFSNEPMYLVSNLGRVKSQRHSESYIITNIHPNNSGYLTFQFTISKKRYSFLVHRMVMIAFHWESNLSVNHKDGNKLNNKLENLEYYTQKKNTKNTHNKGLISNRKGIKSHLYKVTWSNHPKSEAILQLDMAWNVIKQWESLSAPKEVYWWNKSHISKAIRMNKRAYWFAWKKVEPTK